MTCAICRLNSAVRICGTCDRLLRVHGIYPASDSLPFQCADKDALEAEMLTLARESFMRLWQCYGSHPNAYHFEQQYQEGSSDIPQLTYKAIVCGLRLNWHKVAT